MMTLNEIRELLSGFDSRHWYRPIVGHHLQAQLSLFEGVVPGLRPTHAHHLVYEENPLLALTVLRNDLDQTASLGYFFGMEVRTIVVVATYAGTPVVGLQGLDVTGDDYLGVDRYDSAHHWLIALDGGGNIDVEATSTIEEVVSAIEGVEFDDPFDLFCDLGIDIEPEGEERALADVYRTSIVEIEVDGHFVAPPAGTDGPTFVITAYNPGTDRPTDTENEAAMSRLLAEIQLLAADDPSDIARVTVSRARGSSHDRVHCEPSWAVHGIGRFAARELGREFGQIAIFEICDGHTFVLGCFRNWRVPLCPKH